MLTDVRVSFPGGYEALRAVARVGSAISREADSVRAQAASVANFGERSQALFGRKIEAISQLLELEKECGEEGWDGDGAAPLAPLAALIAQQFLTALPERFPIPEFAVEPDGAISLDWIWSRTQLFSVSIGSGNRIAFAWLDGSDSGYGVASFDGQTIPRRIREGIAQFGDLGGASVRAA